ncbi:MAG: hypothetical protein ACKVTZ_07975 [Bacteroidia bacterium]
MMKKTIFFALTLFLGNSAFAQYESVLFDYQNATFNNGQALPAESDLLISGPISRKIQRVEVSVYRGKGAHRKPLYQNEWKRVLGNSQETFQMPFHYKLHGASEYDFSVDYFRKVTEEEKEDLRKSLHLALDSYIGQCFEQNGKKVKMLRSEAIIMNDLNQIMKDAMIYYRNESEIMFGGFSDIARRGLQNLSGRKLRRSEAAKLGDVTERSTKLEATANLYTERLGELKALLHNESDQLLNTDLLIRADERRVSDYPTKHTRNTIAINAGYGAAYFNGNSDKNIDYGRSPYVGLSFPLGKSAFSGSFLANSSISVGAFTNNMKDKGGNTVSGPIFGRPYYVAYGYRAFRFIRVNAGAAFLETRYADNTKQFMVRPFVGVSAELSLWLGLGDKH